MSLHDLADSWASIYSNSALLRSGVSFAHIGGLLGGGGCAVAADRATLLAIGRGREAVADEARRLHGVHALVIAGLAIVIVSGVLLALADLDAYLESTGFWIKMALVALLLMNGGLVVRGGRLAGQPGRENLELLRLATVASLILWFATTLAGAALPNVL